MNNISYVTYLGRCAVNGGMINRQNMFAYKIF